MPTLAHAPEIDDVIPIDHAVLAILAAAVEMLLAILALRNEQLRVTRSRAAKFAWRSVRHAAAAQLVREQMARDILELTRERRAVQKKLADLRAQHSQLMVAHDDESLGYIGLRADFEHISTSCQLTHDAMVGLRQVLLQQNKGQVLEVPCTDLHVHSGSESDTSDE